MFHFGHARNVASIWIIVILRSSEFWLFRNPFGASAFRISSLHGKLKADGGPREPLLRPVLGVCICVEPRHFQRLGRFHPGFRPRHVSAGLLEKFLVLRDWPEMCKQWVFRCPCEKSLLLGSQGRWQLTTIANETRTRVYLQTHFRL